MVGLDHAHRLRDTRDMAIKRLDHICYMRGPAGIIVALAEELL